MGKGYIKLDRALENWRFKTKPNYVALWVHLLLEANHQSRKYIDTNIERGQLTTSLEALSKGTGLSLQQIRTILNKLKDDEITIKTTNKYTLITIVNYDKYQSSTSKSNKQNNKQENENLTINQQTNNKQITTNNNVRMKEINNIDVVNKIKIKNILSKWIEAGYDENLVDVAERVLKDNFTEDKFKKVMNILTNADIVNPIAYIQTLKQKGAL